jgi:ribosomal protein L37AE/L43A
MGKVALEVPVYGLKATLLPDRYSVQYDGGTYNIPIEKLHCNYGGVRYYFHCPKCSRRMRILYCSEGLFQCRKCLNIGYYSQRLRPSERYLVMCSTMRQYIKLRGGDLDRGVRPFRMHKKHFSRIVGWYRYRDDKYRQAVQRELRQWYGAKAEPYLDEIFDYVDESKSWQRHRRRSA